MKAMAETFKDKSLKVFGLNTARIKAVIPTVLPVLEVKENRTDYIFLLEDGTLLHLEFMSPAGLEPLKRFLLYDARLLQREDQPIQTAVIYSGRVTEAPDFLSRGSLTYSVNNVYMKDYDGDEEYRQLHTKVTKGQTLTEEEILKLIFLPLMRSKSSEEDMAIRAAELAKDLAVDIQAFVIGAIIAVADRILPEEYKRRLMEVLKMTQIEQWLKEEGRAEGLEEGLEKGLVNGEIKATQEAIALYLTTRYGEASHSLQNTVRQYRDLSVLEALLKALYTAANFSEAQDAIEHLSAHEPLTRQ